MGPVKIGFHPTGKIIEAYGGSQANVLSSQIFFTPAHIGNINDKEVRLPDSPFPISDHHLFFREDSFDPAIRIRRGRFYKRGESSNSDFHVSPHATGPQNLPAIHSIAVKDLGPTLSKTYVHLGLRAVNTRWSLIQAEPITNGEILITLKAVTYLGVLPDVEESRIPSKYRTHILEKLNRVAEDFNVATPNSIIEITRDAASAIMSALVAEYQLSEKHKDLGDSARLYMDYCTLEKKAARYNVGHCAKILANLHIQNKSVEQLKNEYRPIGESDAEIALNCLGQMIRDLGWAN